MFYAALLLKTSQIPLFLDVGSKNTVNYGVFGHLTFKNIAICSGFCLPEYKNRVKNGIFVVFFILLLLLLLLLLLILFLFLFLFVFLLLLLLLFLPH